MADKTKKYLFHNVYGDCSELLASKPQEIIPVPWGPDPETEGQRNMIISELGITPSALPSLVFWVDYGKEHNNTLGCWSEIRISDLPKPWAWVKILSEKDLASSKLTTEILG